MNWLKSSLSIRQTAITLSVVVLLTMAIASFRPSKQPIGLAHFWTSVSGPKPSNLGHSNVI